MSYICKMSVCSSYLECQLWLVNSHKVFHWTHEMLTHWLRELEALDQETVLVSCTVLAYLSEVSSILQ